jgi:trigger factor
VGSLDQTSGSLAPSMQTTVENPEKHTVKLTIEVPVEQFSKDLDRTYRTIANQVKIPGFRKGKVPKPIIDAQVGRDAVLDEFVQSTVPTYFRQAVSDEELAPIGSPEIDLTQLEPGKPFVFTATVEVRPRLELTEGDYKGVKVTKPSVEVSEEEIDEWVERLRQRFAELEPVERAVKDGDFVTANITATKAGEPVESATRDDYLYGVGSGEFGAQLDSELLGTKPGDILSFHDTLPERFGEELTDGSTSFQVLVKDVKGVRLPQVDDDFAKTASEFDTYEELRRDLRDRLKELKERETLAAVRDRALDVLVDGVDVEIPDSLIADETQHRISHAREQAERMGLELPQMLEAQGWDEDRLRADSQDHAVRAIKADLVLEGIARAESMEVTAEEIGAEIQVLAQAYGREPKEVATSLERSGQVVTLAGDIIRSKALDLIVEHADIVNEASGAESEAATDKESP